MFENYIIPVFIIIATFLHRFLTAKKVCMTWDEVNSFTGVLLLDRIFKRDFSQKTWSFSSRPPILLYLCGLSYSVYIALKAMKKHGLKINYELLRKEALSSATGQSALLAIRFPILLLGSLSCLITYVLCLQLLGDWRIALLSALILALTPHFIAQTSVSSLDGGIAFFYLLTLWLLYIALKTASTTYLALSGISLGLTIGSKETGFIAPIIGMFYFFFFAIGTGLPYALPYFLLWILIGVATLYLVWPLLWGNPLNLVKSLKASAHSPSGATVFYRGAPNPKPDFYLTNLAVTTPIYLVPLYIGGAILAPPIDNALLLSWILIPLLFLSLPIVKPRDIGVRQLVFIYPALSILAGLILQRVFDRTVGYFNLVGTLALSLALLGAMALECFVIHPYYLDYYNQLVGGLRKAARNFLVGWWGEGMDKAMTYIDENAPRGAAIWIYGPKGTAVYHSNRVNLKRTQGSEPIFTAYIQGGFEYSMDETIVHTMREGDLKFYFPDYYPERSHSLNLNQLASDNVSHIVLYRHFIYPGQVDSSNYELVKTLRNCYTPVYIVKVKGVEFCWVYSVRQLLEQRSRKDAKSLGFSQSHMRTAERPNAMIWQA